MEEYEPTNEARFDCMFEETFNSYDDIFDEYDFNAEELNHMIETCYQFNMDIGGSPPKNLEQMRRQYAYALASEIKDKYLDQVLEQNEQEE